jgi:deazaflavin-dependent oxidoreductase (nitroreductase family)
MGFLDVADRIWPFTLRVMRAHTFLYQRTDGRLGHTVPKLPNRFLLLDHVGAKSGIHRTSPLQYVEDGDTVAVIASKGGFPKHPAWFHNLKANPDTIAQIGPERRRVHARVVSDPEERERIWVKAVRMYRPYETYRDRAGREIPIVVLERR